MIGNYSVSHELKTDDDIQRLKQPLSRLDLMTLRQKLQRCGCIDPIIAWEGFIIDGDSSYDICKSHNIPFRVIDMSFNSKDEVYVFVCKRQLLREDLTNEMYKYLIGRLYLSEVNLKASNSFNSNKIREQYLSGAVSRKQDIVQEVSSFLGVCVSTVQKYTVFAKCVDSIRRKDPSIAQGILDGQIKISHRNLLQLEQLSSWELKLLKNCISPGRVNHIDNADINSVIKRRPSSKALSASKGKPVADSELPIRKIPQYDPDAEISTLIYTIPTWISSISRSQKNTDFQNITPLARDRTLSQLGRLTQAIVSMEESLRKDQQNES